MRIYVVGNILVEGDSLPLKLLPKLRECFQQINFIKIDPNENFTPSVNEPLYIIDTVVGIKDITIFASLDVFTKHRVVSSHDYDLLFHLNLLKKLNKLPEELYIIGIPAGFSKDSALPVVARLINEIIQKCTE